MAKKQSDKETTGELRSKIPALDGYLRRVGAEESNFRRYMVKDYRKGGNYYIERTLIRINPDGTIRCSRSEHAPTAEEAKAIAEGFVKVEVPRSIESPVRAAEKKASELGGDTYLFPSRRTGKIIMVRQRFIGKGGEKVFLSHTLWSDGLWRVMEPDDDLPFWKPLTPRKLGRKMIHEGEKAAHHVDRLVNHPEWEEQLRAHPWGEELRLYEHWGMIGGALAPHRTDYSELTAEKPTEVVYVCDNDTPGESALQIISKCYGESMAGIRFGDGFKRGWDMADEMPRAMFSGRGEKRRWIGKSLKNFMSHATYATEVVPVPGTKSKTAVVMRKPFLEEWVHSVQPEVYLHRDWPQHMWGPHQFNNLIGPYSDVDDTARLLKKDAASKSTIIKYDPSRPSGVFEEGGRFINTHMPSDVKAEEGDPAPFLKFMEHLISEDRDRTELMRWCATLIARPDVKMNYGVLLISEAQGVGKGTLGEKILAPLVGEHNTSYPSEADITESQFNSWAAHKRLAVVHEIYAGQSSKAYNRLKSTITDKALNINLKHVASYEIDNWLHVYACSNSMRAIRLSMEDRRWFVPRVTDKKLTRQYWEGLNYWLQYQGGLGIVKRWATDFLRREEPVVAGAEAPWTSTKGEVIEDGYSPGMRLVAGALATIKDVLTSEEREDEEQREKWTRDGMVVDGNKVVLLDVQLVSLINQVIYNGRQSDRLEKPMTMRKLAKSLGWHVGDKMVSTGMRTWGQLAINGRIISNDPDLAATHPTLLGGRRGERAAGPRIKPLDLGRFQTM